MSLCTIVISTANQRVFDLELKAENKKISYVIVHQVYDCSYRDNAPPAFIARDDVTYIRIDYPGLSKSRNIGLSKVNTKYAYIMDDDVDFDIRKIIELVELMELNNIDAATCRFKLENGSYPRRYSDEPYKHNILSAAKVSSIEICVSKEVFRERNITFDENFGLGTELPSGEEYVFLTDCIKEGVEVWFYPITIGVHPNITSGLDFFSSPEKTFAKREMFKRIFGRKFLLFVFLFWLKKSLTVLKKGFFFKFTKTMLLGLK